jgi:hypothetical protein
MRWCIRSWNGFLGIDKREEAWFYEMREVLVMNKESFRPMIFCGAFDVDVSLIS